MTTASLGDHDRVGLGTAALRAGLIPLLVISDLLDVSEEHETGFWPLFILTVLYALGLLALRIAEVRTRRFRLPQWLDGIEAGVDLLLLSGLTYTSGGAFSELSQAFFLLPVLAAIRLQPRLTAGWAAAAVVAYLVVSLVHPGTEGDEAVDEVVTTALYLAWVGVGAVLLSDILARRSARIETLAADRGRLAAQAINVEERERRRLAEVLHDESVQNLLHARQELAEARRGETDALERAEEAVTMTIGSLRGEIREMHPTVLEHVGLPAAVQAVADEQARRGNVEVVVDVDPAVAGRHDLLVHSLTRELVGNAVRHAQATRIEVRLSDDRGGTVLEVRDDGRGMVPGEAQRVVPHGHIGLASSAERVAALGGTFDIDTAPGAGVAVRATLPAPTLP